MGYVPLFESLTRGTLYGRWPDIGLWPIILALADKNGDVDATHEVIAGITGLPIEDVIQCLKRFCLPDPKSRCQDAAGARLALIAPDRDWGWHIVNHALYREKARLMAKAVFEVSSGQNRRRMQQRKTAADRRRPPLTPSDPLSNANADSNKEKNPPTPLGLDLKAWEEWFAYKQASEHKLKPVSIPHAQRELAGFGAAQARVVSHSIANGWQGLFAPKNLPKAGKVQINPDGSVAMFAGKPVEWPSG